MLTENNKIFSKILIFAIFMCFIIHYLSDFFWNGMAVIEILLGFISIVYITTSIKPFRKVIVLILIYDFFCFLGAYINKNANLYVSVGSLFSAQAGGILLFIQEENIDIAKKMTNVMGLIIVVLTLGQLLIGVSPMDVGFSKLVGRNSISILFFMIIGIDMIYRKNNNLNINFMYYFLIIVINVLLMGRGGLISIGFFSIGILSCQSNKIEVEKFSGVKLIFLFIIIFMFIFLGAEIINNYLGELSTDNGRLYLWESYYKLSISNISNFLFGANLMPNKALFVYHNIHNEFFNIHCFYGLIPFVISIVMKFIYIFFYFKRKQYKILILILALIIRSCTDATGFAFSFIWVYCLCDLLYLNKKDN